MTKGLLSLLNDCCNTTLILDKVLTDGALMPIYNTVSSIGTIQWLRHLEWTSSIQLHHLNRDNPRMHLFINALNYLYSLMLRLDLEHSQQMSDGSAAQIK